MSSSDFFDRISDVYIADFLKGSVEKQLSYSKRNAMLIAKWGSRMTKCQYNLNLILA